jgi:hypothetical protein
VSDPGDADGGEEEDELGGGSPHVLLEDAAGQQAPHQVTQEPKCPNKVHRVYGHPCVPKKYTPYKVLNISAVGMLQNKDTKNDKN